MTALLSQVYNRCVIQPLSSLDQSISKYTGFKNYEVIRYITNLALSMLAIALLRQGLVISASRFYPHLMPKITSVFKSKIALLYPSILSLILSRITDNDRKKITDPQTLSSRPPGRARRSDLVDFFKKALCDNDFSFLNRYVTKKNTGPLLLEAAQALEKENQKPIQEILNQVDEQGCTLFWAAIRSGHRDRCDIMQMLIEQKIDVNIVNQDVILIHLNLTVSVILQLIHRKLLNGAFIQSIKDKWNKRRSYDRDQMIRSIRDDISRQAEYTLGLEVTGCSLDDLAAIIDTTFDESYNWK